MKTFVKDKEILLVSVQVMASIFRITRSFNIVKTEEEQSIFKGDEVIINKENDEPLFEGVVENVSMLKDGEWHYSGRSKSRIFSDLYIKETKQFTEEKTLKDFLSDLAKESGIEIKGDFTISAKAKRIVYEGESIIDILSWLVAEFGVSLICDAKGNLTVFEKPSEPEELLLSRGTKGNISRSAFKEKGTLEYDKYTVISSSPIETGEEEETTIKGSFGDGEKEKIFISKTCLTEEDCKKRAELEAERGKRESFIYEIETAEEIEINRVYSINDTIAGVIEDMLCVRIDYYYKTGYGSRVIGAFSRI